MLSISMHGFLFLVHLHILQGNARYRDYFRISVKSILRAMQKPFKCISNVTSRLQDVNKKNKVRIFLVPDRYERCGEKADTRTYRPVHFH